MYIEQAYKGLHEGWRYLLGTFIIVFFWLLIGQLPLTVVILSRAFESGGLDADSFGTKALLETTNLSPNWFTFLMLISFVVGLAALFLVVKYLHKQPITALTTTRRKIDWKRFFLSFGLMAAFVIVATGFDYFLNPEDFVVQFRLVPFAILFIISILLVPLQTSFEEFFFRGYLMQGLGVITKNRWFPLIITSLVFGGLHLSNPEVTQFGPWIMVYYIGTGLFLGILTLMDDGLELALGFHAANNLIQILLVTADWSAFQSESILRDITRPESSISELIVSLGIIYPIFILIFAKKYKWKNWKDKLFGKVKPMEPATEQASL